MIHLRRSVPSHKKFPTNSFHAPGTFLLLLLLVLSGCNALPGIKSKVGVPPLLGPLADAGTSRLLYEINRVAAVQSIEGKVDIQFLDTSFAQCGIAERYRSADGDVIAQRPHEIYLVIQVPFVGTKIAEMASDGSKFRVAVLQGEDRYRRFVQGTNSAVYPSLDTPSKADCGGGKEKTAKIENRAVGALSGLRPQHLTDALLLPPAGQAGPSGEKLIYSFSEAFIEESDTRPNGKKGARVVRGYYVLDELAPEGDTRADLLRRIFFDRVDNLRIARVQTFDSKGQITTDVLYKDPRKFGADGQFVLASTIELTRPQDHYSLRITYQFPESAKVNKQFDSGVFVLQNKSQLPELDLDARRKLSAAQ